MGRQKYQKLFVLPDQTARLAIPELAVIKDNAPIASYEVVHQRYFSGGYPICPKCGGTNTRPLKVVDRQLKDIVGRQEKASDVIDLIFHQRYYRCLTCGNRVFPEKVSFAEPGVHFTNRLSDILADGTLLQSYEKVCKEYGVPASKASVGSIMRRRLQFRMSQLPSLKTPRAIAIFVVRFYREEYPVILSLDDHTVRFIDILPGSSAAAYSAFFSGLDRSQVKQILIDPDEQLLSSAHTTFPNSVIAVSKECIQRFAREAFKEVFQVEAKHCTVPRLYSSLINPEKYLREEDHERIERVMKKRPRLHAAYIAYQDFLNSLEGKWNVEKLLEWAGSMPDYLEEYAEDKPVDPIQEFDIISDILTLFRNEVNQYLSLQEDPAPSLVASTAAIEEALANMPYCIYDVLQARMLLNTPNELITIGDKTYRLGIPIDQLVSKIYDVNEMIRQKRENDRDGYDTENESSGH